MNRNGDMPVGGGIVTFSDFGKATVSRSVNADTLTVSGNAVLGGNTSLIDVTCTDLDVTGNFTAANLEIDGITVNENIDITGELDVNQTANFHGPIIAENIECDDIDCVNIIADSVTTKTLGVTTMTADDITVKKLHIIEYIDEVTTTQFKTSVSTEGVFSDTIVAGTTVAATDTQGKRLLVLGDAGISGTLGITGQVTAKNGMVISYGDLAMTNGDLLMAKGDLTMTDGDLTMTAGNLSIVSGVAQLPVGMQSQPSLTFAGDTNTGLFHPAADSITLVSGGFDRFTTRPDGCLVEGPNFTVESVQTNIEGNSTFTGTATFNGGITSSWGVFSGGVAGTTATFSGGVTAAAYTATSGSGFSILDTDDHKLLIRTDTSGTYIQAGTTTGNGSGSKLNITTINNRSQTATFDTVNQRVGINQAAPQFTLDVVGDAQVSSRVLVGISGQNSATLVLQDGTAAAPSLNFGGGPSWETGGATNRDRNTGIWHPSDGNMQFVSNGQARFTVGATGCTVNYANLFYVDAAQSTFSNPATFNGGITSTTLTTSGLATFNGGITATSANIGTLTARNLATFSAGISNTGTITSSGLATFNGGITATSANIGTLTSRGAATFSSGISNTGTLTSSGLATFNGGITATSANIGSATVTGSISANGITVGSATVTGSISANGITVGSATVNGSISANGITVPSATVTGDLSAGDLTARAKIITNVNASGLTISATHYGKYLFVTTAGNITVNSAPTAGTIVVIINTSINNITFSGPLTGINTALGPKNARTIISDGSNWFGL